MYWWKIEGENFAEYFSLLKDQKHTRNNSVRLNLRSVKTEFLKRSVYFSGAKLYNELPVQIWQLDFFEKFRKSINTFFDWDRRHWIIAFLILHNINLEVLRRNEMLLNFSMEIFYVKVSLGDLGAFLSSVHFPHVCAHIIRFLSDFYYYWASSSSSRFWCSIPVLIYFCCGIFLVWQISIPMHYWS